jgi:hypothetical protein
MENNRLTLLIKVKMPLWYMRQALHTMGDTHRNQVWGRRLGKMQQSQNIGEKYVSSFLP